MLKEFTKCECCRVFAAYRRLHPPQAHTHLRKVTMHSEKSCTKGAKYISLLTTKQRLGEREEQTPNTQTLPNFVKDPQLTYHLLIVTIQHSGMTYGKSPRHVSSPRLTTQVTHSAISVEGLWCTGTSPKGSMATRKGSRQGERREQQTPQTTGGESENVKRMSQA